MGNEWDNLGAWANRAYQGGSDAASKVYGWGSDNPLQALSLGVGAVGTGMGIWDAYQANQRARERQKLAEQYAKMGPTAFAPSYNPQQLQAMYFRPAAQNMAFAGQTDGGSFRQALADAALKAESDRIALGNQIFSSRLGALGYGPPLGPTGNTGAFGSALQNIMLTNALRGRAPYGQPQTPGATATPGGVNYSGSDQVRSGAPWNAPMPNTTLQSSWDMTMPNMGLQSGQYGSGGNITGNYSLYGGGPVDTGGLYPSSAFEGQY